MSDLRESSAFEASAPAVRKLILAAAPWAMIALVALFALRA